MVRIKMEYTGVINVPDYHRVTFIEIQASIISTALLRILGSCV